MEVRCGGRHLAAVFPRFRHRSTAVSNNLAHQNRPKYRTASSVALGNSSNGLLIETSHELGLESKTVAKPLDGAERSAADNFLEPEDEEYHRVVLPRRPLKPIVIPWPTLLPHHGTDATSSSSSSTNDAPREPVVYLPSSAKITLAEVTSKREQGLVIHPCEALSKAVGRKDWETADQLLKELEDLGIPIRPEEVYIRGAVQQLRSVAVLSSQRSALSAGITTRPSDEDMIQNAKSLALKYLSHYPIRPIQNRLSTTRLKALQPFFTLAMDNNYTTDLEFTEHLLRICASRGLLRMTIHTGLFREWCERVETVRGYKVMNELVETAWSSTSSREGKYHCQGEGEETGMADEETGKVALMKLGSSLRNVHLRALIHVATRKVQRLRGIKGISPDLPSAEKEEKTGALELAKSVYVAGSKVGVMWDPKTKGSMVNALRLYDSPEGEAGPSVGPRARKRVDLGFARYLRDAVVRRRSTSGMKAEEMSVTALAKETRRIVRGRAHLPLSDLVEVLAQLEVKGGRQSLARRLKERFVGPEKFRQVLPWDVTETTKSFYYTAQVTKLKKQGKLGEAIGMYKKEFLWHGLPSLDGLPLIQPVEAGEDDHSKRKLRPTSHAITGVLDAILQNLDPSQRGLPLDLHNRYIDALSTSDTSDLILDPASHLPFVLAMIRSDGPLETQKHLEQLEAKGVYPGVPCWTALATEFAKRGYSRRALRILAAHPMLRKAASTTSDIEADKSSAFSRTTSDQKRGTPRMYAAVAAMHYRAGRVWRAREVIGKMHSQNSGVRGPCIRRARFRWMRSRDRRLPRVAL